MCVCVCVFVCVCVNLKKSQNEVTYWYKQHISISDRLKHIPKSEQNLSITIVASLPRVCAGIRLYKN